MSDDPTAVIALWFLGLYAVALATPVVLAVALVLLALKLLRSAFVLGRDLLEGDPCERELRRAIRERNAAIRDIVRLRHDAERQLREIARRRSHQRVLARRRP